jgi:Zn-dependent peptidase ImmA (M78 family)
MKNRSVEKYRNQPKLLLEDFDLLTIPINIDKLAEKLEIELSKKDLNNNISGEITYNPTEDIAKIIINSKQSEQRQRFSIAHEIAHYIYDLDFSKENDIKDIQKHNRGEVVNPIERRADKFAEKLLMPYEKFTEEAIRIKNEKFGKSNNLTVSNIHSIATELSSLFNVSKSAVYIRLHSVKLISYETKNKLFMNYR